MSFEFFLPELGEGISSGTVIALSYKAGDSIKKEEPILEIETDKAAMGLPSPVDGVLVKYCVAEGQDVKVGDLIAIFEAAGETKVATKAESAPTPKEEPKAVAPAPAEPKAEAVTSGANISFTLPELGEGIGGGAVIGVYVKAGDQVAEGDPLIELETDKAAMSVPSPYKGVVKELKVKEGAEIKVGELVAVIESSGKAKSAATPTTAAAPVEATVAKVVTEVASTGAETPSMHPTEFTTPIIDSDKKAVRAGPATRKLARELGVDLSLVKGSKRAGRVDVPDIKSFVKSRMSSGAVASSGGVSVKAQPLPDFAKFGGVHREPLSKIRKIISDRMTHNWNAIPHVFQFQDIDITDITKLQKKYGDDFKEKGSTASPTNFFIKAMVHCLQKYPQFNASIDLATNELIYKEYFNIGVAVDTPAGLIVPVLRNVDQMSIFDIGKSLREIAKRGRDRKILPDEMTGACMTLSNLGGIGGTHFTPIVNWPEVAILGVARSQKKPVYIDGQLLPREIVTVCLSYDHRVIDGADAARFVVAFKDYIENYEKTLMGAV